MLNNSAELEKLGFDNWFTESLGPDLINNFEIARVLAVHKESYIISNGPNEVFAELVGKKLYSAVTPEDFPAVGDWVLANFYDDDTFSIIHEISPRKTLLRRKTPGKRVDFQLIAANIDTALIVQSLDENFNLRRLERYLVMVNESKINPIVLLSKSDLLSDGDIAGRIKIIKNIMPHLEVYAFSNEDQSGLDKLKEILAPGVTYCLLGSSGVGKTSLLNNLLGKSTFKTEEVREKDHRGRHATTHRHLIKLDNDALLIDTPGMRELGNFSIDTGLDETFDEIAELAVECQFSDCTHEHEKGCAVLAALEDGSLSAGRFQNYIKMKKEAAHHQRTYFEKRQRDKEFGKMVKSVMKHKKNR